MSLTTHVIQVIGRLRILRIESSNNYEENVFFIDIYEENVFFIEIYEENVSYIDIREANKKVRGISGTAVKK